MASLPSVTFDRQARALPAGSGRHVVALDLRDQVSRWYPQGVHVTEDTVFTTAYRKERGGSNGGSRLTVLDRSSLRYGHVDLGLRIHAGGLAIVGGRVYVAATRRGLAVLDLPGLTFLGYEKPAGDLRYSFCSVATDGGLVVGEYDRRRPGRLWHDGRVWEGTPQMQGAVHDGTHWWISRSNGPWRRGWLLGPRTRRLPAGPEDLALDPDGRTLWTVTEYAGRRCLVATGR